jgi:hypothetical protein
MKAIGVLFLVLILSLLSSVHAAEIGRITCPVLSEGETALDCPWAGIVREIGDETNPIKVEAHLARIAPDFVARIQLEGKFAHYVKNLWGRSINFDENAKATIVSYSIIDVILKHAGVFPRVGRIVHAGFEHTYGYLLSNLNTPYGYKRLRWVRPDIENGFGLERGSISPTPRSGGLLMNLSTFIGNIAFRGNTAEDRASLHVLEFSRGASRRIREFDYAKLHGRRLTETVVLEGGRQVELRTDFVPFTMSTENSTGGNTELLIYSVRDSGVKNAQLISAFPIAKGFSDMALKPENLGNAKPVITRYNAFVSGITDSKTALSGRREASEF